MGWLLPACLKLQGGNSYFASRGVDQLNRSVNLALEPKDRRVEFLFACNGFVEFNSELVRLCVNDAGHPLLHVCNHDLRVSEDLVLLDPCVQHLSVVWLHCGSHSLFVIELTVLNFLFEYAVHDIA